MESASTLWNDTIYGEARSRVLHEDAPCPPTSWLTSIVFAQRDQSPFPLSALPSGNSYLDTQQGIKDQIWANLNDVTGATSGDPLPRSVEQSVMETPRSQRTMTGCFACRNRKYKCDEARPVCNRESRMPRLVIIAELYRLPEERSRVRVPAAT
jgi:hypothetical protein